MRAAAGRIVGFGMLILALGTGWAHASDADILGIVRDTSGAVVPGVTITARHVDTGLVRTAVSDTEGRYRLIALPAGPYELTAELAGFQTVVRKGIVLTIGMRANENLTMSVARLQESVTVTGESPIVETTSSEVGVTFTRTVVDDMPLNGRNPTDLLLLAPGVSTGLSRGGYAISGSLERNNSYTVDGIDNNDDIVGGRRVDLQQDVVREFQLVTNQFSAENGRAAGGAVNVLTQSGTNEFKGRVNLFWRDDAFDAQPYLSKQAGVEKSPFSRKTYGGNLGGPIVRDRTHFFAAFEDERETETLEYDLPSIDYAAVGPYPAVEGGFRVQSRTITNPKVFGKGTHQFSTNHSLNVTFNYDRDREPHDSCVGTDLTCVEFSADDYLFIAAHTWVISSKTLNEIRVARTSNEQLFLVPEDLRFTLHDRPGIDYGQQNNMPQGRDERHLILTDTFSRVFEWKGDHDLRFGGEVNIMRSASFFDSNFGGTFLFETDRAFDPNDRGTYPTRYTVRTGDSSLDRDMNLYSGFIQDNWRVTPGLTFNLGVRYDREVLAPHLRHTGQRGLFNVPGLPEGSDYRTDGNNVAPRVGFAWDVDGSGKTVVRGGSGVYYDQVFLNIQGNVYRFGVVPRTVDLRIDNPCYPDPTITSRGVCGESIQPGAPTRSPTVSSGLERSPYAVNTSLGVVRQLTTNMAVSVDAVRLRTRNWPIAFDLNPRCTLTGSMDGGCTGPIGSDLSRPDPRWLAVTNIATKGDKWYTGLQVGLQKRFANNYQYRVAYTLSKTEDTAADFGSDPQNYLHPEREKALSTEDQRHRLAVSGSWRLPLGVHVGGILAYASWRPFNIRMGTDWNGNGNTEQDRPDSSPTRENVDAGTINSRPYYPQGPSGRGADGVLPRNSGRSPDYLTLDLRVSKVFPLGGNRSVEVLAEFFNLTNRVNQDPREMDGNVRSTQYYLRRLNRGEIAATGTYDPFQGQLGLRINF
jgi:hypothetical protein